MIVTLLITIIVEGAVILIYCIVARKPLQSVLVTSIVANLFTQSLLWSALYIFFRYYVTALIIAELLIWILEGVALYGIKRNQLGIREGLLLSLVMNAASFGIGLFLPY